MDSKETGIQWITEKSLQDLEYADDLRDKVVCG